MSEKLLRNTTIIGCVLILALLVVNFSSGGFTTWPFFKTFDAAATGQFGDFVGGVIGTVINAAAFYFLYLTLNEQKKATDEQRTATEDQRRATVDQQRAFELERFESKFFELVKFHRDNIQELEYTIHQKNDLDDDNETTEKSTYSKRKVFRAVFEECMQCRNEIKPFFHGKSNQDVYTDEHLALVNKMQSENNLNFNRNLLAAIDIAYCVTFYGVSGEGIIILKRLFSPKYQPGLYNPILDYLKLKPKTELKSFWSLWRSVARRGSAEKRLLITNYIYSYRKDKSAQIDMSVVSWDNDSFDLEAYKNYTNNYKKYYGGHQFRLGHYYRHLYQTIKFVDRYPGLSDKSKYNYIKILRAQLSTYEQALLFLNSLSSLGWIWELLPDLSTENLGAGRTISRRERKLITKYNLIKNLPAEELYGINIKEFYPDVNYEQV